MRGGVASQGSGVFKGRSVGGGRKDRAGGQLIQLTAAHGWRAGLPAGQ